MDLDLPTGRRALLLGGTGVLAAAFLAACGDDSSDSGSGTTAPAVTEPPAPDPASDLSLSATLASLEVLAVDAYTSILDAGTLKTPAVLAAAKLFQSHHEEHLESINGDVKGGGADAVSERNDAIYEELVKPKLAQATAEGSAAALLAEVEDAFAQTYAWSAGADGFTTPDLRKKAATIAGIDARHAALLSISGAGDAPASIFPSSGFFDTTKPLTDVDGALLEVDEG